MRKKILGFWDFRIVLNDISNLSTMKKASVKEIVIVIVLYFTVSIHRICPTDTLNMKIVLFYLNNFLTTLALEFRMDIYFLGDITGFSNLYAGVITDWERRIKTSIWNMLLLQNPQFLPNNYGTSAKWPTHE